MSAPNSLAIERCPHDSHSPTIGHRTGGVPANVLNVCGICGNTIARVDGAVWVAIPKCEVQKVTAYYK